MQKQMASQNPPRRDYKAQVNVRLTSLARNLLTHLARAKGISQADILEMLIRDEAIRQGFLTAPKLSK